jgi:hypothetical protein
MNNRDHQAAYRQRQRDAGLVKFERWIKPAWREAVAKVVDRLIRKLERNDGR